MEIAFRVIKERLLGVFTLNHILTINPRGDTINLSC